jgi:hypothetical protein
VGGCPNTYVYTKGLAEQLLETKRGSVPLAIVRPSIVTAAESEPFPGWVDNMNGATGNFFFPKIEFPFNFIWCFKMTNLLVLD